MIKEVNYTATVKETYCDFCDTKAEHKCEICGKDLCEKHSSWIWINNEEWDREQFFCKDCYKLFSGYDCKNTGKRIVDDWNISNSNNPKPTGFPPILDSCPLKNKKVE